jgi:hypothetical protein
MQTILPCSNGAKYADSDFLDKKNFVVIDQPKPTLRTYERDADAARPMG